jgi:hypothetical protein
MNKPQIHSSFDLAQLKSSGGPFDLTKQIGYGNTEAFSSTCTISQSGGLIYDTAKITFTNAAGQFMPGAIFLNPQTPTATNITLQSGLQVITIKSIQMGFPTPQEQGTINLQCAYTDYNGGNPRNFNGTIATWTGSPS